MITQIIHYDYTNFQFANGIKHFYQRNHYKRHVAICVLFLFIFNNLSAQLPTGGLVVHYAFDNDANDKSGNNNHGQISGGVSATEDRFGNPCGAMRFNGTDGFITVQNSASLKSPVSSFSFSVWFKLDKSQNSDLNIPLLAKAGNGKRQYGFTLNRAFGNSYSEIIFSSDVTVRDENYNSHRLETEQWYFLAVSYEENWVNIFLNNNLIAQSLVKKPFSPNDFNLEIGRDATKYFNGSLDDLTIYNRALSPFEITAMFSAQPDKMSADNFKISLPKNIEKNTDAGKCFAVVTYQEPMAGNTDCGKTELKQIAGLSSGSQFNVGQNIIVYEATAPSGKKTIDSFSITIFDKENPVIKCPNDITVAAPAGSKTAKIDYTIPTATDNCNYVNVEFISGNKSGENFDLGTTTVRYKATDAAGNSAECSFKVTVERTVQRTLHCTEDVIAYARATGDVQVNYTVPYVEIDGTKTMMRKMKGLASGSSFSVGKNEIAYEFTDTARGNLYCNFNVIVRDTIAPSIVCPSDVRKTAEVGKKSIIVTYSAPKAGDNGKIISAKLISGFASGTEFPIGTTDVKYEAVDEVGNRSECSFKVIVDEQKPVEVKIPEPPKTENKTIKAVEEKPIPTSPETKEQAVTQIQKPVISPVEEVKPKVEQNPVAEENEQTITQIQKPVVPPVTETKPKEEPKPTATEKSPAKDKVKEAEKAFFPDEAISKPRVVPKEETHEAEPKPIEKPIVAEKKVEEKKETTAIEKKEEKKTEAKVPDTAPASTAPIILECVRDITMQADRDKCGAVVNYAAPFVRSGVGIQVVQTQGGKSGSLFKVGTTVNTFQAKDVSGKMKECSFNIIVKENIPPVFNCPNDTVITLPVNRRGIVYYYKAPEVKDNCGIDSLILETGSKSGCFLEVGVHPFIYKAVDASGNSQSCTHSVIIKTGAPPVKSDVPKTLSAELELGSDSVNYEYKAETNNCLLTAFIYDDGEEDNDTVSIIFNGQVIVNREMIHVKENRVIKRTLILDKGNENYIISKAWNTGRYGLNTLRIDIYEGDIQNEKKELRDKKPAMSKVIHSKPGVAGGMILKCKE